MAVSPLASATAAVPVHELDLRAAAALAAAVGVHACGRGKAGLKESSPKIALNRRTLHRKPQKYRYLARNWLAL